MKAGSILCALVRGLMLSLWWFIAGVVKSSAVRNVRAVCHLCDVQWTVTVDDVAKSLRRNDRRHWRLLVRSCSCCHLVVSGWLSTYLMFSTVWILIYKNISNCGIIFVGHWLSSTCRCLSVDYYYYYYYYYFYSATTVLWPFVRDYLGDLVPEG